MRTRPALTLCLALTAAAACSRDRGGADSNAARTDTSSMPAPAATPATPTSSSAAVIMVAKSAKTGSYLTDSSGRALYLFEKDAGDSSSCYDACAAAWPPFIVTTTATSGDSAVRAPLISTVARADRSRQVTYNGKPLYYYAKDTGKGDTKGQDVEQYGAEWYLVSPAGTKQEGKEEGDS